MQTSLKKLFLIIVIQSVVWGVLFGGISDEPLDFYSYLILISLVVLLPSILTVLGCLLLNNYRFSRKYLHSYVNSYVGLLVFALIYPFVTLGVISSIEIIYEDSIFQTAITLLIPALISVLILLFAHILFAFSIKLIVLASSKNNLFKKLLHAIPHINQYKWLNLVSRSSFILVAVVYTIYFLIQITLPFGNYMGAGVTANCYIWNDQYALNATCRDFIFSEEVESILNFFLGIALSGFILPMFWFFAWFEEPMFSLYWTPVALLVIAVWVFSLIYLIYLLRKILIKLH